jgi:hypothetical protein
VEFAIESIFAERLGCRRVATDDHKLTRLVRSQRLDDAERRTARHSNRSARTSVLARCRSAIVVHSAAGCIQFDSTFCFMTDMKPDDRAQLIEDIRRTTANRERIVERASADKKFDIAAAWETLEELDRSIYARILKARSK